MNASTIASVVKILLVDDHELVRRGVHSLLSKISGIEIIGEACDGHDAVRKAKELRPDIVLMDIIMPSLNGLDATARLASDCPETRVIVLSMNTGEEFVTRAIRAGAAGYILKNSSLTELELAIRAVARGETYLCSAISKHVVDSFLSKQAPGGSSLDRLTSRQREVLQNISEGYSTKEIAGRLHISVKTVETHRSQIMQILDIHDIAGLVRFSLRHGLISVD